MAVYLVHLQLQARANQQQSKPMKSTENQNNCYVKGLRLMEQTSLALQATSKKERCLIHLHSRKEIP